MTHEAIEPDQQAAELEALAQQAETEDFIPEPDTVEGEYQSAEPEAISTGELCAALLSIGFGLVASRRGDHWKLNEAEANETGQAVGAVLDKYFPDMGAHGPELTALLTVGAVLTPRLMADKQIESQRAKARAEQQAKQQPKPDEKPEVQSPEFDMKGGIDGD